MRTDFDPLRDAELPDSFDRTAAWLRAAPPRPSRARPVALLALVALAGAWSWPVRTTVAAGAVVEVLSADSVGAAHPALATLDDLVPVDFQHFAEAEGRTLRYAVLGASPAAVDGWRAAVAALPSTQAARVLPIALARRRPLGLVATRRMLGISPTPLLSDAELQAELNRVFADAQALALTVERAPDGRRRIRVAAQLSLDLAPGTRIAPLPGATDSAAGLTLSTRDHEAVRIGGRPLDDIRRAGVFVTDAALDTMPPALAEQLRQALARRAPGDSASILILKTPPPR